MRDLFDASGRFALRRNTYRLLPRLDRIERMRQHDDIQRQIVPDHVPCPKLEKQPNDNRRPDRQPRGGEETDAHKNRIADGIQHTVAEIIRRDRRLAAAVDDEIGILKQLSDALGKERDGKPHRQTASAAPQARARHKTGSRE
jgi:hypothetical protein